MRTAITALAVTAALTCPCLGSTGRLLATQSTAAVEDVTIYRVPLMCAAARGLGCGSRAKPVLLDLQKKPTVAEAWLNQAGDLLAITWVRGSAAADRRSAVETVSEAHGVSMDELAADARTTALTSLRAGSGWHRGADVDRLSEQEARIIADRLVRRVTVATPSARAKATDTSTALTKAIAELLVAGCTSPEACRDTLLAAARTHLDTTELAALRTAIAKGFTPIGAEK